MQAGIELSFAVLPEPAALLQPGERPLHHPSLRQHHEGVQFVAFHHFHRGSQQASHPSSKGLPGVAPIHQHVLQAEAIPVNDAKAPARSVTFLCGSRGNPCVSTAMWRLIPDTCPRHSPCSRRCQCSSRSGSPRYWSGHWGPRQPIFFKTCPEWNPHPGRAAAPLPSSAPIGDRRQHAPLAAAFQEVQHPAENVFRRGLVPTCSVGKSEAPG